MALYTRTNRTPSLGIIAALDRLAVQVRKNHPEVPKNISFAVVHEHPKTGVQGGHFTPATEDSYHQITIAGESLANGAKFTFNTLLHELAHATAAEHGVKDTSNRGRYHNKNFRLIAESLGTEAERVDSRGWAETTLADDTAEQYAAELESLEEQITAYREGLKANGKSNKPERKRTKAKIDCGCNDPVTVSIKWFAEKGQALQCTNCGQGFHFVGTS